MAKVYHEAIRFLFTFVSVFRYGVAKQFLKDKSASREIVLNNSSAHITGLGASFVENKNTTGVNGLISDLGFPNYK